MYCEKVMDHFKNPTHAGALEDANGVGTVGNPACGDVIEVYVKIESDILVDVKFKTFGCCAAIASSDAVCALAKGLNVTQALELTKADVVQFLGTLPTLKVHCSILGIDALKVAIDDYQKKKSS